MHPEVATDDAAVLARSDRTGAGSVMAPRGVPYVIPQLLVALPGVARLLLLGNQPFGLELRRKLAHESYADDDRIEILSRLIAALLEIMKIDQRRVARVGRAQRDLAAAVLRMRL